MSLPLLTTPKHRIELPSTGERIEFRPFLVKEQKLLLMATNGGADQQISALNEVIHACTFGKVNAEKLPAFDAEFLFLNIRAHSVGETVNIVLTCSCEAKQDAKLDVTSVKVDRKPEHSKTIDVDNNVSIEMRYPTLTDLSTMQAESNIDSIINLIAGSIDSIWEGDERIAAQDYSVAELVEFVENLNPATLDRLENFFVTMPVLRHDMAWDCKECGKHNEVVMEGMNSFFA
jgi:hypothetical protein